MYTSLTILEWTIVYISVGAALTTLIGVMFFDKPTKADHVTTLQKVVIDFQGFWILLIIACVLIPFVAHFFNKTIPWAHIACGFGIGGSIYTLFFFWILKH